jgi:hypothetical protein
LERRAL